MKGYAALLPKTLRWASLLGMVVMVGGLLGQVGLGDPRSSLMVRIIVGILVIQLKHGPLQSYIEEEFNIESVQCTQIF